MLLQWYEVDDKDVAASFNDFVFRLKMDTEKQKLGYSTKSVTVDFMKLQVRKRQNVDFRDVGYKFLTSRKITEGRTNYVDDKQWDNVEDIIARAEEILVSLDYINADDIDDEDKYLDTTTTSDPSTLRAGARGVIHALQSQGLYKPTDSDKEGFLEDMFLRLLSFWETREPLDLKEDTEKDIRLKELEIEVSMLMREPTMYFVGGWPEAFKGQSYLHDEDWLKETLEEEEEERQEWLSQKNDAASFKTDLFSVKDSERFEYLMGRAGLHFWVTESGDQYLFGSSNESFEQFLQTYEDLWNENFITKIQEEITEDTVVSIYSAEVFEYSPELGFVVPIGISGEVYIITNDENHRITLEKAGESKLNGLKRKWSKARKKEITTEI